MAYVNENGMPVVLKKYRQIPRCLFCGRYDGREFRGHLVCEDCLNYIRKNF